MGKKNTGLGDNEFLSKTDPLAWMKAEDEAAAAAAAAAGSAFGHKKADNVVMIPIDLLEPDPENYFNQNGIEELADSIEENGLQHNLVVRPIADGRFRIISGERRWTAHKLLVERENEKFKEVMCQVKDIDEIDAGIDLIIANIENRTVTPLEKIESVKRLTVLMAAKRERGEVKGKTKDLVGEILKISGFSVVRLNKVGENLIPELKDALENQTITFRSAFDLADKPVEYQREFVKYVKPDEILSESDVGNIYKRIEKRNEEKAEANEPLNGSENENERACKEGEKWATSIQKTIFQLDKQVGQLISFKSRNPEAYNAQKDRAARLCQKINELKVSLENTLIESAMNATGTGE